MNNLEEMRHTLSHVLAAAVRELYPDANDAKRRLKKLQK